MKRRGQLRCLSAVMQPHHAVGLSHWNHPEHSRHHNSDHRMIQTNPGQFVSSIEQPGEHSMTTIYVDEKRCANCGVISTHHGIGSTNEFGSSDLDTRPPEMLRSTMEYWVEVCPACGYASQDLTHLVGDVKELVAGELYRHQRESTFFCRLANAFLCSGLLHHHCGHLTAAAWDFIHAAWACDDVQNDRGARICRQRAIATIEELHLTGDFLSQNTQNDLALLTDIARRCGDWARAERWCSQGMSVASDEILQKIFAYQKRLIDTGETAVHTVAEAVG
jgi:hypothetical protein